MKIQWSTKFRSQKKAPAKSTLCCEKFSQPQKVPYENGLWLLNNFAASRSCCEIAPWLRNNFAAPYPPSEKIFAAAKHPLGTRVPFHSTIPSFRNCEMGCENAPQLQNRPFAAKSTICCENEKRPLTSFLNVINSLFHF